MDHVLEPDRDQIEIFAQAIFRHAKAGFVSLRSFLEGQDKTFRISAVEILKLNGDFKFLIDVAEDDARRAAQDPKPVVFCPPLATFRDKKARPKPTLSKG